MKWIQRYVDFVFSIDFLPFHVFPFLFHFIAYFLFVLALAVWGLDENGHV